MNCATSTLKYLVFVFNFLCAIVGLATVIVSGLAIRTLESDNLTYCIFGIVLGGIVFLVSFFGCCGTYREKSSYMYIYAGLLAVLFALQLAIILSFHSKDFDRIASDMVKKMWDEEVKGESGSMANLQSTFQCCGLNGPQDYPNANLTIPASCYNNNGNNTNNDHLFEVGCLRKMVDIYAYAGKVIKITNWTLFGIEGVALIFSLFLARTFSRQADMRYVTNN